MLSMKNKEKRKLKLQNTKVKIGIDLENVDFYVSVCYYWFIYLIIYDRLCLKIKKVSKVSNKGKYKAESVK